MGFLDRLRGSDSVTTTTRTTIKQRINVTIPAAQATAVQAALERWAQRQGWAAVVNAERDGDNVKLALEHDDSMPGKPPEIDGSKLGEELQRVVQDAIKPEPA
jgi:hypothetical protein